MPEMVTQVNFMVTQVNFMVTQVNFMVTQVNFMVTQVNFMVTPLTILALRLAKSRRSAPAPHLHAVASTFCRCGNGSTPRLYEPSG
jgi:hypothetical protein